MSKSSDEELQSTNAELKTAKEELQSAHEELTTIHEQLQSRNTELSRLNDDVDNLLTSADVAMMALGIDLRIRRFTPAAAKLLNLLPSDVGRPIGNLKPSVELPDLEAQVAEVIHAVQPREREVRDREGRLYALRIYPFRTAANKIDGAVVVLVDITERQRAEESRQRLAAIVESSEDAILSKTLDGIITSWNQGAERLYGYSAAEILGKSISILIPPDYPNELAGIMERLRRGETIELNETARRRKDGRLVDVSVRISPILDAAGQIIGDSTIARDISGKKRHAEALSESNARKAAILQMALDAIITIDHQGKLIEFNPAAEKMFGCRLEDVLGQQMAELIIPPSLRDRHYHGLARYLATGEGPVLNRRVEMTALRADGTEFPVELAIAPISDSGARYFTGSIRDITERKQLEEELWKRVDELAQADRRKTEFLAILAHELRNPLAPLRNGLEVLRLAGGDASKAEETQVMMERQVHHLTRLIDDLLDVSRISRGRIDLRKERVELAAVVNHALEVCRSDLDAAGHELTVRLPPEPLILKADPVRLVQVVENLLNNAIKYTHRGGRIAVTAEREGGEAVLRVRDSGQGIDPEFLPRIWDLFMQADPSRESARGGLGIGLTMVRDLVQMHGGLVEAHSEGPGKGSEFVVRLPIAAPSSNGDVETRGAGDTATPSVPGVSESPTPGASAELSGRRILLVDDNADVADVLGMLLRLKDNEVHIAYDGPGALDAAARHRPEIILLDIALPGMSGYEVARRLRQDVGLDQAILIAASGYCAEEDRRRSLEAGFDGYLVKPIEVDHIQELLSERELDPGVR
jgi:two-component system CheB/CheR fusion protein